MNQDHNKKTPKVSIKSIERIFTAPENSESTLAKIEQRISENLHGFLQENVAATSESIDQIKDDFVNTKIPDLPCFVSDHADFLLEKVVRRSVNTASPTFVGHMTSAIPYFMLPLSKMMIALNQNLIKIETSKAFTPLERQVIAMIHRLAYDRSESFYQTKTHDPKIALGMFCSGGTLANLGALWIARNKMFAASKDFGGIQQEGLHRALNHYGYEDAAILVSERGHYSFAKSADLLGLGRKNVHKIKTDSNNKIKVDALKFEVERLKRNKIAIIGIVGIAGTTETGNVDPLDKIAEIAKEHKIHFHVDAAWGGPVLFSKKHKYLMNGVQEADSITFDAHKQLYVPMGAGMVVFKDDQYAEAIKQSAKYVIRAGSHDLGKFTVEGSRPGMALLVHSALHIIGKYGFELLMDRGIKKANSFAKIISEQEDFEVITEPETNILTYRYNPKKGQAFDLDEHEKLNELIIAIQKVQRENGKTFVSRTTLKPEAYNFKETIVFRVVLANPLTDNAIFERILKEQREIALQLY